MTVAQHKIIRINSLMIDNGIVEDTQSGDPGIGRGRDCSKGGKKNRTFESAVLNWRCHRSTSSSDSVRIFLIKNHKKLMKKIEFHGFMLSFSMQWNKVLSKIYK
ncbi:MAG: hypothetical protein WAN92_02530 [Herbaspirillum sp.]